MQQPATKEVHIFFDQQSSTFSYLVVDLKTKYCALIDPVLNYRDTIFNLNLNLNFNLNINKKNNQKTAKFKYKNEHKFNLQTILKNIQQHTDPSNLNIIIDLIQQQQLKLLWVFETHIHADHLTGAYYLQEKLNPKIAMGQGVQKIATDYFKNKISITPSTDQHHLKKINYLLKDQDELMIGELKLRALQTPGHTPTCMSYLIEDSLFVGDALLMPSIGTGRTDFLGGSAQTLYRSIQKIFELTPSTLVYTCHDYPQSNLDNPQCQSTVAEQRLNNIMINKNITEAEYIQKRQQKDEGKAKPKLLELAILFNLWAINN